MIFSDGILDIIDGDDLIAKETALRVIVENSDSSHTDLLQRLQLAEVKDMPDDIAALFITRGLDHE